MKKDILISVAIAIFIFVAIGVFFLYAFTRKDDYAGELARRIRNFSYPSYMEADYSEHDGSPCIKTCSNREAKFSFDQTVQHPKAWSDFKQELEKDGFTLKKQDIGSHGVNHYSFNYNGTDDQCAGLSVKHYLDLHHIDVGCHLELFR